MQTTGRPQTLDETLCSQICDLVAAGNSVRAAARVVGCNVKTIRRHAERDENFARLLRAAELRARKDPLKMLQRATGTSWRAAAWLLERTAPDQYGKQPASACRPEQVQDAFTRLLEAALQEIPDGPNRRTVYQRLAKIAEEESLRMFLPPSLRPKNAPHQFTPIVDEQRLFDMLDSTITPNRAPNSSERGPKSPPPKSATNPEENNDSHK